MARFWPTLLLLLLSGCNAAEKSQESITLATTTSVQDTGLLDMLLPLFQKQSGIQVKAVAVGSGQALEIGRRGDADVLITHAPAAEKDFMAQGFGAQRQPLMRNDFVLLGPTSDPIVAPRVSPIAQAVQRLADQNLPFISRGDESGTHIKEREIWRAAGIQPEGPWYIKAGGGMAQTLRMASEKRAYTLSDRGTFVALRKQLDLKIVSQGDPLLINRYSLILVNPAKHTHVRHAAARQFAEFLRSPDVQRQIADFGVAQYGEPLFFPDAGAAEKKPVATKGAS